MSNDHYKNLRASQRDFHMFCVWNEAESFANEAEQQLRQEFRMIRRFTVDWSPDFVSQNFSRLYGVSPDVKTGKEITAGSGPFQLFLVEDESPVYALREANSGRVEWQNSRVTGMKEALRLSSGRPDAYLVHSSNSASEFWRDSQLILGSELVFTSLGELQYAHHDIYIGDLTGSRGWKSAAEFITFLNRTTEYVSLRPAPFSNQGVLSGGDFDFLVAKAQELSALANAKSAVDNKYPWQVWTVIDGAPVMLDLREIGDGDLDESWQRQMLQSRCFNGVVYQPNDENYFFSLIHHLATEKLIASSKHLPLLQTLALRLGVGGEQCALSDADLANLLVKWLKTHKYSISTHVRRVTDPDPIFLQAINARELLLRVSRDLRRLGASGRFLRLAVVGNPRRFIAFKRKVVRKVKQIIIESTRGKKLQAD